MYHLDFVCIDHSDEISLDAQLRKMVVAHMVAGDFDFATAISNLVTALFRFKLPATESAIAMSRTMAYTLTDEQKKMLKSSTESPIDRAVLNDLMSSIIHHLFRHDVATWKLALYRLDQLDNLCYTLEAVNKSLGYVLFDEDKITEYRAFIFCRKSQVTKFIEEEKS